MGGGSKPSGVLSTDKKLTPEAAKRMSTDWREHARRDAKRRQVSPCSNKASKYQPIAFDAMQMDFIKSRQYQLEEVARLLRIPLYMVGGAQGGKGDERLDRTAGDRISQLHADRIHLALSRKIRPRLRYRGRRPRTRLRLRRADQSRPIDPLYQLFQGHSRRLSDPEPMPRRRRPKPAAKAARICGCQATSPTPEATRRASPRTAPAGRKALRTRNKPSPTLPRPSTPRCSGRPAIARRKTGVQGRPFGKHGPIEEGQASSSARVLSNRTSCRLSRPPNRIIIFSRGNPALEGEEEARPFLSGYGRIRQ